ncbi:Sbal_3080 family lipoprotein [Paraferrimonas haliotis]|uniref:Lipoprotein n=1 Tax=Paraferrimonas haliotis TaxID=2013866 RepID=A0AA37TP27_9GAMM|nr:Sbal_3080 family lipoprotein [Paraferrimonas haliotis]GLS83025.1 hypothetical protein GCM10007894_10020 [Paraferrimonas haliotis]
MLKQLSILAVALSCLVLSACSSPHYRGHALAAETSNQMITIIKSPDTRAGFLTAMTDWLTDNGYRYEVVDAGSKFKPDNISLEYVGRWRWDLALFLNDARIEAFTDGQRAAYVEYKAPNNFNGNKFSDAETRIDYMMDVLFGKLSSQEATKVINLPQDQTDV